jgi:hypothetical protein
MARFDERMLRRHEGRLVTFTTIEVGDRHRAEKCGD